MREKKLPAYWEVTCNRFIFMTGVTWPNQIFQQLLSIWLINNKNGLQDTLEDKSLPNLRYVNLPGLPRPTQNDRTAVTHWMFKLKHQEIPSKMGFR